MAAVQNASSEAENHGNRNYFLKYNDEGSWGQKGLKTTDLNTEMFHKER